MEVYNPKHKNFLIKNLYEADWTPLFPGIKGRTGASGPPFTQENIGNMGIDLISLEEGASFPMHTHPGSHILFILHGEGYVVIEETTYETSEGDCFFIPGNIPHAVGAKQAQQLLAIGFPHKSLIDPKRMDITDNNYLTDNPMIAKMYSGENTEERTKFLSDFQNRNNLDILE